MHLLNNLNIKIKSGYISQAKLKIKTCQLYAHHLYIKYLIQSKIKSGSICAIMHEENVPQRAISQFWSPCVIARADLYIDELTCGALRVLLSQSCLFYDIFMR